MNLFDEPIKFELDESQTKCDWCAETIYKGFTIFEIGTNTYCSENCVKERKDKLKEDILRGVMKRNPGANQTPVWNFVWTAGDNSADNVANLQMDAQLYGWRKETVAAITEGLTLFGKLVR